MDLPWGSAESWKFITNVGLITSDGPYGVNIMAAEWTHHVSYRPGLVAICIGKTKATLENIRETKEFGISLASTDQSTIASIAGNYTRKDTDKISALKELGFEFYKAKKIKTLMVKGASLNAECKVINEIPLGDHVMFVGEVVEAEASAKEPVAYHKGRYWLMDTNVHELSDKERERIKAVVEKHRKQIL